MSLFFDAIFDLGAATVNIPIAQLVDSGQNIFSTIGISVPAAAIPNLAKIGLFDYKVSEGIAKTLFESAGRTTTGQWMDIFPKGVSAQWHRMHHHHFLTDAVRVIKNPELSIVDFYKHLATDVVTKNGLPILPKEIISSLSQALNITPTQIMPWVSFNILDLGGSIFAVSHSGSNLVSVIGGSAQWGFGYAANTFGAGALKLAVGIQTQNPIIIGSGAVDITCGSITSYKYYSQPFLCGVPVSEILNATAVGASFGAILALAEIFLAKESASKLDKIKILAERISTSSLLSSMSAISIPLGVTTALGLTGFSLARQASEGVNQSVRAIPIQAGLGERMDSFIASKHFGQNFVDKSLGYVNPDKRSLSELEKTTLSYFNQQRGFLKDEKK